MEVAKKYSPQNKIGIRVSVVVCAYTLDRFQMTCEAVQSLKAQTIPPDEVILVIDHNNALYDKLKATLSEDIIIVKNEGPRGVSAARNTGINKATGNIIATIDDDATANKDWLETIVQPLLNGSIVIVGGKSELRWVGGERPIWFAEELDWIVGGTYKGHPETPAEIRNVSTCCMAALRSAVDAAGCFDERIGSVNGERRGGEEAVFCLNIKNALPDKLIWYEPLAIVQHNVHAKRASIKYVIKRSYQEGVSKAILSRLVRSKNRLSLENYYLGYLIKKSIPHRLAHIFNKASFLQTWVILFSSVATITGYLVENSKTLLLKKESNK